VSQLYRCMPSKDAITVQPFQINWGLTVGTVDTAGAGCGVADLYVDVEDIRRRKAEQRIKEDAAGRRVFLKWFCLIFAMTPNLLFICLFLLFLLCFSLFFISVFVLVYLVLLLCHLFTVCRNNVISAFVQPPFTVPYCKKYHQFVSFLSWYSTSTASKRLIREGQWWSKRGIIYRSLHCHQPF